MPMKCPACGEIGKYHAEDEDSLGNVWWECDACGDTFTESDAEYVDD